MVHTFSHDLLTKTADFKVEHMQYRGDVSMKSAHYHDHYEILYMMSGRRRLLLHNTQSFDINAGNIALLKPYRIHKTISAGQETQARILVNISEKLLAEIIQFTSADLSICFDQPVIKLNFYQARVVRQLLYNLLDTENMPFLRQETAKIYVAALLLELSRQIGSGNAPAAPGDADAMSVKIQNIVKYIQNNYIYNISLSAVAAQFHVSAGHLSRCFRNQMGMPFTKYINNIRIITAQRLLADGNISIQAVASSVGFESLTHFERIFKSITGVTPNQYKKTMKGETICPI